MFDRQEFWRDPGASSHDELIPTCRPEYYLDLVHVTDLVVSTIEKYGSRDMSILEIGCGTGRNLIGLMAAGFEDLSGIEISQRAVDVGCSAWLEYNSINVTVAAIEDVARQLPKYDVIFTQGCLMHLPLDLDWVIQIIKKQAQNLILTVEGEPRVGINVWARDYQEYIEQGGRWSQVEVEICSKYPPLPVTTIKRVFERMG